MTMKPKTDGTNGDRTDYISTADITTPREWGKLDVRLQRYLVEIECFTLLRQLMEMEMTKAQALDLLAATLMRHDPANALKFREAMVKVNDRYQYDRTYSKGLVRYFWCSGMGINKMCRYTGVGQARVYRICYDIEMDMEMGKLATQTAQFMTVPFMNNVDLMIRNMTTFEGCEVRKPNWTTTKFDTFRASLRKETITGRKED